MVLHPGTSVLHHNAKPQLVEVQIEEHMSQDTALPGASRRHWFIGYRGWFLSQNWRGAEAFSK